MPPQAPGSLKHEVDGCEVGCDQVEIQIKTLLGHLGGNENLSAVPASTFTKDFQNLILAFLPPVGRKTRVKEKHFRPIGKPFADTLAFALQRLTLGEKPVQFLGSLHRIDKCQSHSATGKMFLQSRVHARQIRWNSL